ncbi:protein kinase [Candidatus Eisenbacteria bacterium]|uniref:Protein kinase n=1 Tax=Eiseniibacteriota bacterium TaxID=2212470 RepID=A0ABV6YQ55_UNCEI
MTPKSDEGGFEETRSFKVLAPGTPISHYKIIEKIGEGGMGVVYKAADTKLNRTVALKFLPPRLLCDSEAKERFEHEARAASAPNHHNIATIYEIDEVDDRCFISMEYLEGGSLKELLKDKELSMKEILDLALQICEGLSAAHESGTVHRDLKPDNIMLTKRGRAKITDFGLAKLKGVTGLTREGTTLGTLQYMSPEQVEGAGIDHRSDIFSFGVVLYEMVTGQPPFKGDNQAAVIHSILTRDPEPMGPSRRGLPSGIERIIAKALAKQVDSRYQSAEDMLADLRRAKDTLAREKSEAGRQALELRPSIAVLPFTNLSADPDQEYFCDGMAEEIINVLTHVEGLRVVARTSAFAFKGRSGDIREIGKQLDVESVLEGSVRKAGTRVRITAQLVSVADGYHIWSEKFDREMQDIFGIQDEISLAIVDRLRVKLLGKHKAELTKHHTENLEAYHLYLKGRYFWNRRTGGALEKSVGCFEQAIEKDPAYAFAYFGLADAYHILYMHGLSPLKEAYPKAKRAVLRALELDDSLAGAHTSMAEIKRTFENDPEGAEQEFRRAIELSPGYATAHHWYSIMLVDIGRFEEAVEEGGRALELDPLSTIIKLHVAQLRSSAWDWDGAEEMYRHALEIDAANENILVAYALFLARMERREEAVSIINRALELAPDSPWIKGFYMAVLYYAREFDESIEVGLKLLGLTPVFPVVPLMIGACYIMKGMYEEALAVLGKARELLSEEHTPAYLFADLTESFYGFALAKAGKRNEAQEVLAGLLEKSRRAYVTPYVIGLLHLALDDIDSYFDWLERASQEHDRWLDFIRVDPLIDDIRSDPRYNVLLKKMGLSE